MALTPTPLELVVLVLAVLCAGLWQRYGKRLRKWLEEGKKKRREKRHLRPRTPEDCPRCRANQDRPGQGRSREVRPWCEVKGRAGRPKQVSSEGHACTNPLCTYYGITDASLHALVSDGKREDIQYWQCQACGRKVSERYNTLLYRLKTTSKRVAEVLTALAEGVDISAATRIFGHHPSTITRWLTRAGEHGRRLHDHFFRDFIAEHLQLDELVARVKAHAEYVYVWTAVEAKTKVLLVVHVGRRKMEDALAFIHELKERLVAGCLPVFTSDGLNHYFYALTAHFGRWVEASGQRKLAWQVLPELLYGQMRKLKSGYRLKRISTRVLCGTRSRMRETLQAMGLSGKVMTAFVERLNLTLRELVAPLSRRTWSMAHDEHTLRLHLEWGRAYDHFARPHESLRLRGPARCRDRIPAMAAGIARTRWSVREMILMPLQPTGGH